MTSSYRSNQCGLLYVFCDIMFPHAYLCYVYIYYLCILSLTSFDNDLLLCTLVASMCKWMLLIVDIKDYCCNVFMCVIMIVLTMDKQPENSFTRYIHLLVWLECRHDATSVQHSLFIEKSMCARSNFLMRDFYFIFVYVVYFTRDILFMRNKMWQRTRCFIFAFLLVVNSASPHS